MIKLILGTELAAKINIDNDTLIPEVRANIALRAGEVG